MLPKNLCIFCKWCYKKEEDNVELVEKKEDIFKLENEIREFIDDFELIEKDTK